MEDIPVFSIYCPFLMQFGLPTFNPAKFPAISCSLSNFQGSHGSRDKINKQSLNVSSSWRFPLIPDLGKLELISFLFLKIKMINTLFRQVKIVHNYSVRAMMNICNTE